ncbi:dUTPase-like protein [Sporodiniella umbellata]|nr:dUTPase-like protein [Sporodiniella umbellata]
MSTDEPPKKAVHALKLRMQVVKKHLEPIFSKSMSEISTKLTMTEKYELQVLLSYSLNTLFYIYLKTQGSDPQKLAIMGELQRVQEYIRKLKVYQGKGPKPDMRVDKEAAGRFIRAAINPDSKETSNHKRNRSEVIDVDSSSEDERKSEPSRKKGRGAMDPFSVKRLSEYGQIPTRGSAKAAGYDLYCAHNMVVPAKGKTIVATDISIAIPDGHYGRVAPRSGLASKHHLDTGAGVIDADYRGPLGVLLFNFSDIDYEVKRGDRIAQLIVEKISTPEILEVDSLEDSLRGSGGFGSTGYQ